MNLTLLLLGLTRAGFWLVGAWWGWREKRYLAVTGFTLTAINSAIFTTVNARGDVPPPLSTLLVLVSTPLSALVVAAFIAEIKRQQVERGRWTGAWRR